MKRVLLVGAAGWGNVGDDLIGRSLTDWAKFAGYAVDVAGGPLESSLMKIDYAMQGSLRSRISLALAILRADVVLIGGGGLLDDRLPNFYRPFTRVARLASLFKKPYSFVGIGVGPIHDPASLESYASACAGARAVMVRDAESADRLKKASGALNVTIVPDPVLWGGSERVEVHEGSFECAVNLRNWSPGASESHGALSTSAALPVIAEALRGLPAGARVGLFSMSSLRDDDDLEVLEQLASLVPDLDCVLIPADAASIEKAIAASKRVVSMRLHGCLLSVRRGVPVLGIAYDAKIAQQGRVLGFRTVNLDMSLTAAVIQDFLADDVPVPSGPWGAPRFSLVER
ncbi:polysaccharide pyruvyl transferase family protein [Microbacterium sp. che218]|uniref:polysaccharide pyruvyl transferase family protein n=1 Tax=Microbacterium sp. che218 TaxID=3140649 RepID=UPI003369632F